MSRSISQRPAHQELSPDVVTGIREALQRRVRTGKRRMSPTLKEIAEQFGVGQSTVTKLSSRMGMRVSDAAR